MKTVNPDLYNVPFGGKVMVFGGDFRQTLPIVKHGNRSAIVSNCINRSSLWKYMKIYKFTINKRIELSDCSKKKDLKDFADFILRIGEGEEKPFSNQDDDVIKLPKEICVPLSKPEELIEIIYENIEKNYHNSNYLIERAILVTTNKLADYINAEVLKILPTEEKTYYSADICQNQNEPDLYPIEFLNSLNFSGLPPHKLNLKLNSVVICIRNLNSAKGLCNRTRLIIRNFKEHVIECEIITGSHKGEHDFLPRITLMPNEEDIPFEFKRRQFPIKLAFSLTVNKAQGQTIPKVGFYINAPLFHHGQLYTVLSRVSEKKNIVIMLEPTILDGNTEFLINNIVYKEVFNNIKEKTILS